jgi:uncharacterized protein (TIGR01777 family)
VLVLSRSAGKGSVVWDGRTVGDWASSLDGAEAVINVCGKSVGKRWTKRSMKEMRDSRIEPTSAIAEAIQSSKNPPKLWINTSAIGYYGHTGAREVSEATRHGEDFLAELCVEWEAACLKSATPDTRKVCLRLGVVLDRESEFVKATSLVAKLGLGAALGSGRQYISWVHMQDVVKMFEWCLYEPATGAVNVCAPRPATNAEYMAALRAAYGLPALPNVPAAVIKLVGGVLGKEASLLLTGQRAVPEIALARGFRFRFDLLPPALDECLDTLPKAWRTA